MQAFLTRVLDDLRLARRSFEQAPALWLAVIAACVALTAAATAVGDRIGGFTGYLFGEFRFEGQYAGTMTVATAFFLAAAGMSLFVVAGLFAQRASTRRLVLPWAIAATGLLVLGADDLMFAHEILAYRLAARGVPLAIGENLALGVYVVGTLLVLPRLLETVRRYWKTMFPLVFGLAMFATTVFVEIVVPGDLRGAASVLAGIVDHSGKLTGTVMMLAFAQMLVVSVASDPERATR